MISARTVLDRDGVTLADVACRHGSGRGRESAPVSGHTLVFVRRGCFVRSAEGVQVLLDPTAAYAINPGEEERYDHPHEHGDDCTALHLDAELLASLWGGDPALPRAPLPASPAIDLEHRRLLAAARRGADPHALVERAVALAARTLAAVEPARVASGRPDTARARKALADGARAALAEDPDRPLPELARELGA